MKSQHIHPEEHKFFWNDADSIVAFAQRNKMKLRGHTLVWHNQVPAWFFDDGGKQVSKEKLLERLRTHIHTVVKRYKGKIYAWDVVNEAISDAPGEYLRNSKWLQIIGKDYIAKAFEFAHEADPDALLFYNDYNEIDPVKRKKIIQLVAELRSANVPIHGVGLQAHWAINEPSRQQLEQTLEEFSKLNLDLHITELDISVYRKEHSSRDAVAADANTEFTPEKQTKQAEAYKMCFELFRKYKKSISSVTFWNISDRHSWLDNFPVRGRKDYPLLFDRDLKPKSAFWEVTKF
jgi:endo-1,4-beta-xylanase